MNALLDRSIIITIRENDEGSLVYSLRHKNHKAPLDKESFNRVFPRLSPLRSRLDRIAESYREQVKKSGPYELKLSESELLYLH